MNTRTDHLPDAVILAETVKRIEAAAPLEDSDALTQSARDHAAGERRVLARADILGRRFGLQARLQAWRGRAGLAWLALALLVYIVGHGIVTALLGNGRTINATLAFFAVLGAHFISLALWAISLVASAFSRSSGIARLSLGYLLLRMLAFSPAAGRGHSAALLSATVSVLQRGRLLPWLFGFISHTLWAAAFVLALLAAWIGFSFREYRLTWETTIQDSAFFVGFIQSTAMLPQLLGFTMPDASSLVAQGGAADGHRALAYWLMGCIFAYGLLPRALLALLSLLMARRRCRQLRLDMTDPYYLKLLARFAECDRPAITDPERRAFPETSPARFAVAGQGKGLNVVLGFELPPECALPPALLSPSRLALSIAGAADQRRETLDLLQARQPARLLFVCDQDASPDRGTARFFRQAGAAAGECGLLLLSLRGRDAGHAARWTAWLKDSGLEHGFLSIDADEALQWLEAIHE